MSTAAPSKIVPRPAWQIACSASGEDATPLPTTKQRRQQRSSPSTKAHKTSIAELGCVLCRLLGQPQSGKTDVHHLRTGQGAAQRASDFLVIPLCHDGCHQGPHGVHGDQALLRIAKVNELDLLAYTLQLLEEHRA
ncbi:hypothetical protein [Chitiniphilus eburneus]|uniref:hypothetical protein n=1 Tax=Chitiniphilus eburneus TaxID=2571148 RepID=UPI0035CE9A17